MTRTYVSCRFIEGHLNIGSDYLSICASAHAMDGCTQIGLFSGNRMPVEVVIARRKQFRDLLNSAPEQSPCFGCPELKMTAWPTSSHLFDNITINDFSACNLRCDYCSHTHATVELDIDENRTHQLLPLIKDVVENGYIRPGAAFNWGGGEVALYKDFEAVARYLIDHGFQHFVNTNATYYSPVIEYGLSSGMMEVQVSVDSGTQATYQTVKGRDLFETVWKNITRYAQAGPIIIKYILMDNNCGQDEIDAFIRCCLSAGVTRIVAAPENYSLVNLTISDVVLKAAAYMIHKALQHGIKINTGAENFGENYSARIQEHCANTRKNLVEPLFSIIVPTYNHANFLPAALDSLLSQTYSRWEAVIVNDGSTDDTSKISADYAARDRRFVLIDKTNGGTASALNEGLKNLRGEWICWLSSDDLFEPDKLAVHLDAIRQTPEGLFFHSGYSHLDDASGIKVPQPLENATDPDLQVLNFFRSCWVHGNSFAAHRSIFERLGGFVRGTYHNAQDFEMWLRISTSYQLHYIPRRTCVTRIHPAQPTTQFFEAGKLDCVHACYDFINNHSFPDLFPFLDLKHADSARKAITETIRLYLEPNAFIHALGYNPALLERMFEWLENGSRESDRAELTAFCNNLLQQALSLDLPRDAREMLVSLTSRQKHRINHVPQDFVAIILGIISRGDDATSQLMKRYLAEHLLLQAARDKVRENDMQTARTLLEQALRILPFSLLIKAKLAETHQMHIREVRTPAPQNTSPATRVLLINPPYRRFLNLSNNTFPLTFGNMATILEQAGHTVAIYDADFDKSLLRNSYTYQEMFTQQHLIGEGLHDVFHPVWQEVDRAIKAFKPDIVGITAMTPKYPMVEKVAEIVKSNDPRTTVVIGGHHPSIIGEQIFRNGNIDVVVVGEGEVTFAELVQALARGQQDLGGIPGLLFRNADGKIARTATRPPIEDLDLLPIANRDLILNRDYVSDNNIISTRGCPFSCAYCGADVIWKHKQRRRSVANVMEEVRYLIARSGSRVISFWDDSFTANMRQTLELLEALVTIPGLTFSCITRLDLINAEIVAALKQAGCTTIYFGIESGNDRILELMNKRLTKELIREKITLVNSSGISWLGFFIMGYPGETREDILETLEFMKELDPPYAEINIFNPLPGTQTWRELEEAGKVGATMNFSRHSQASTDNLFIDMPPEEFRELSLYVAREFDAHNARKAGQE